MTVDAAHFDALYDRCEDPWGFRHRWYEMRKRDITVAALSRAHYRSGFEAGCSIGELTAALAPRCDQLLACDLSSEAVRLARLRVAKLGRVTIDRRTLPAQWPAGRFDLIVISEIGYYFTQPILEQLYRSTWESLLPDGEVLLCHWRHPVTEYPLTGDAVHKCFRGLAPDHGLRRVVYHEEPDFLLELWSAGKLSVADSEGLT